MPALLFTLLVAAVALAASGVWAWRRHAARRAQPAHALCALLDRYLDGVGRQQAGRFDVDALWTTLEQARGLQRAHFPELYAEMMEISGAHRALAELLLQGHMERHGAPTNWSTLEGPAQLAAALARSAAAVRALQARCRLLAGLASRQQPRG